MATHSSIAACSYKSWVSGSIVHGELRSFVYSWQPKGRNNETLGGLRNTSAETHGLTALKQEGRSPAGLCHSSY